MHVPHPRWTAVAVTVCTAGLALGTAAPAAAKVLEKGTEQISDSYSEADFCGEPGLDVDLELTATVSYSLKTRGSSPYAYYSAHVRDRLVVTDQDTGRTVTSVTNALSKDQKITPHGDGTYTVLVKATGNGTLYGPDGKAIARNPGQVRFTIRVDDGGTPRDPGDDEMVPDSYEEVKPSTGRSDDFCEATVRAFS